MTTQSKRPTPVEFTRQVRQEIKKVTWLTRKETLMTTFAVMVFAAILSVYLFGVDLVIDWLIGLILGKG